MSNHIHLLLTPSDDDACAKLTRNLGQRYAQYFNRRYMRTGTLWEGRPYSCLVDSTHYVLGCYRYIERNPVRAGMVRAPGDYRWSSHLGNAGRIDDPLLTPHVEYLALGEERSARRDAYCRLFEGSDDPGFLVQMRDATNGGFPLLGAELKSRISANIDRPLERRKRGPAPLEDGGEDPFTDDLRF